jgi:hypothetical protein
VGLPEAPRAMTVGEAWKLRVVALVGSRACLVHVLVLERTIQGQGGVQLYIGFLVSKFVQFQILFKFEPLLSFSKLVQFELCSNSKFVNILNLFKFEVCLDSNFVEIRE